MKSELMRDDNSDITSDNNNHDNVSNNFNGGNTVSSCNHRNTSSSTTPLSKNCDTQQNKPRISSLSTSIPRSLIRDVFDKVTRTHNVLSLCLGEPAHTAAPHIVEKASQSLYDGKTKYTDVLGIPEFRHAVAQYTRRVKNMDYNPETEIQVASGAAYGLYIALKTVLDAGDEVIIPAPYFTSYDADVLMCGAIPVSVALKSEHNMHINADEIEKAITPRTRAIILNTPSNPTGAVTTYEELEKIAQLCKKYGLWALSDEVYHPFVFDTTLSTSPLTAAPSIGQVPGMKNHTIIVDSLSKTYAMTGWRIGYILAPEHVIEESGKLAEMVQSSINSTAQYGAVAALNGADDCIVAMREEYREKRNIVIEELENCSACDLIHPQGAFYGFINIEKTGLDDITFADKLLEEEKVAVVPGRAFGKEGAGFVRVSYAGDKDLLRKGLHRFKRFALQHA